jgi:AraC-like DNA-binding protein
VLAAHPIDLLALTGALSEADRTPTLAHTQQISPATIIVMLGDSEGQRTLISALVGASLGGLEDWSPDDGEPPAALFRRSVLSSTLILLQPIESQVTEEIRRALDFIQARYTDPITLADVAKVALYSRCHFCKLFKEQLGVSFVTYLSQVRIRHARLMLARSNMPITNIAFEVGFNDLSHFERVFRALQRQSPSQYRQETKNLQQHSQNLPSPLRVSLA